ncbi:K(+)/H(+) antiporter NhaP2 [Streptomyces sp. RB5]|uniref:K(+)/H(+) antiporter NhaP2 n=1 Tax=Streptomyces smaragdinus TaxID=2585196 RepID=A0A7K0CF63_9ACTN|nr:cation:proton antiporter [Streptomyces smaragdinus]MQY12111.1 K(+)/H(+) antiporter NhaP2 [Streptomyces smaragdinus]
MVLVAVFGVALLIAVLLSGLAARTVLSTSLLFLVGGALVSDGFLGLIHIGPDSEIVSVTADLALFTVLFSDGMHAALPQLKANWKNPARALGLGMPLAFLGTALLTHYLAGLDWTTSFLVGAVLAPTDPVFASAIVSRKEVPARLRGLLNVESGVNDGLALPFVLIFLAAAAERTGEHTSLGEIALELVLGLAFGIVLPLVVNWLIRFRLLGAEPKLQPLLPLAVGVILYAACHLTHANPYLAAFSAGAVIATVSPEGHRAFEPLGESLAELAKFAALLVFGALLTPQLFGDLPVGGYVVAVLSIVLIRPASLLLSLWRAGELTPREKYAAAWFGPKGFASVVYGLLVLQAGIPQGEQAFTLIAVCIAFSIVAHSSTDVPVARMFHVDDLVGIPDGDDAGAGEPTVRKDSDDART